MSLISFIILIFLLIILSKHHKTCRHLMTQLHILVIVFLNAYSFLKCLSQHLVQHISFVYNNFTK